MVTVREILANSEAIQKNAGANILMEYEAPRYDVSQKKLSFKGMAIGSDPKKRYKVEVAIYDVAMDYETFLSLKWPFTREQILDKPVKIDCTCPSYEKGGALIGCIHHDCQMYDHVGFSRDYVKKTDRPERNPDHIPMGCKHIYSFIKEILETFIQKPQQQTN
jgi:hypothetical protein